MNSALPSRTATVARALCLFMMIGTAAGCSNGKSHAWQPPAVNAASGMQHPSREALKAAASLSLTGAGTSSGKTGYARNLECTAAILVVHDLVGRSAFVGGQAREALEQASVAFKAQLAQAGKEAGKSVAQINGDLAGARQDALEDTSATGRAAISCVQDMAKAT